jgi:hypothetical protein
LAQELLCHTKVAELLLPGRALKAQHLSAPLAPEKEETWVWKRFILMGLIGGPDRDRTDDLFHAMEARSQLRHRPTPKEGLHLFSLTQPG